MRLLGQLSALMTPPPEFPDDVTRAMRVAGYSVAQDMMEESANAEGLAAYRGKSGSKTPQPKPTPTIEEAMANIANAVNRKLDPKPNNVRAIGGKKAGT